MCFSTFFAYCCSLLETFLFPGMKSEGPDFMTSRGLVKQSIDTFMERLVDHPASNDYSVISVCVVTG